ncbi:hypothetical protein [Saccharothrix deserti]|uniref:hypothetical protein n=1 Tax=Saccharothrix deserti TaxID=2593674 RepID=UPI001390A5D5|nr:hypothetical protein [Saccharothrix deserti]
MTGTSASTSSGLSQGCGPTCATRSHFPSRRSSRAAYTDALERILGVPAGSVVLVDMATLLPWFEPESKQDGEP